MRGLPCSQPTKVVLVLLLCAVIAEGVGLSSREEYVSRRTVYPDGRKVLPVRGMNRYDKIPPLMDFDESDDSGAATDSGSDTEGESKAEGEKDEPLYDPRQWQWADKHYKYSMCERGYYQSPIDIKRNNVTSRSGEMYVETMLDAGLQPIQGWYAPTPVSLINDERTLQVHYERGSTILVEGNMYQLKRVNIHIPSEHTVDGIPAAAEARLIHRGRVGGHLHYMVVSILYDVGEENTFFKNITGLFPEKEGTYISETENLINVLDTFPTDPNYWLYDGSLTTPPCTEGATIVVMQQRAQMSGGQLEELNSKLVIKKNARPTQPINNRMIFQSDIDSGTPNNWKRENRLCMIPEQQCDHNSYLDTLKCECYKIETKPGEELRDDGSPKSKARIPKSVMDAQLARIRESEKGKDVAPAPSTEEQQKLVLGAATSAAEKGGTADEVCAAAEQASVSKGSAAAAAANAGRQVCNDKGTVEQVIAAISGSAGAGAPGGAEASVVDAATGALALGHSADEVATAAENAAANGDEKEKAAAAAGRKVAVEGGTAQQVAEAVMAAAAAGSPKGAQLEPVMSDLVESTVRTGLVKTITFNTGDKESCPCLDLMKNILKGIQIPAKASITIPQHSTLTSVRVAIKRDIGLSHDQVAQMQDCPCMKAVIAQTLREGASQWFELQQISDAIAEVCNRNPPEAKANKMVFEDVHRWNGTLCEDCALDQKDCWNQGTFNLGDCKCECPFEYEGVLCEYCRLQNSMCEHESILDKAVCQCTLDPAQRKEVIPSDMLNDYCKYDDPCPVFWTYTTWTPPCPHRHWHNHHHNCPPPIPVCAAPAQYSRKCCDGRFLPSCMIYPKNGHSHESKKKWAATCDAQWCFTPASPAVKMDLAENSPCPEPWMGILCEQCGRTNDDCVHGGRIVNETCTCIKCTFPWEGDLCNTCGYKQEECQHNGKLNKESCACDQCDWPWAGVLCEECGLRSKDCLHGGYLDRDECVCKDCNEPWQGHLCDKCPYKTEQCGHGTKLNAESCKCEPCPAPWGGDLCDQCPYSTDDCKNQSWLNPEVCECQKCATKWTGQLCDQCGRTQSMCQHEGQLNIETCICDNCKHPWVGELCEVCPRSDRHCMHEGKIDLETCICKGCKFPWVGEFCHQCGYKEEQCQNGYHLKGKQLVASTQECYCKCGKPYWSGPLCDVCTRTNANCLHGGVIDKNSCTCINCNQPWANGDDGLCEKCTREVGMCKHPDRERFPHDSQLFSVGECKCKNCLEPWIGELCEVCGRTDKDCRHNSRLDVNHCDCRIDCKPPWGGPLCGTCMRPPNHCKNGSQLNKENCLCEINCNYPWAGETCNDCQLKQSDCQHGGRLNVGKCKCEGCHAPWTGLTCNKCSLNGCSNGGTFDRRGCSCSCKNGWGPAAANKPHDCNRCTRTNAQCKRGTRIDPNTCKCAGCPNPYWGDFCEQCPRVNGRVCNGHGNCDLRQQKCNCVGGYAGTSCTAPMASGQCSSTGDPHPKTFDGAPYDWYRGGEFVFYYNPATKEHVHTIQRKMTWNCGRHGCVAINVGMGVQYKNNKVAYFEGKAHCNCQEFPKTQHKNCGPIEYKWINGGPYFYIRETQTKAQLRGGSSAYVDIRAVKNGSVKGLCGNFNGNAADDFAPESAGYKMRRSGTPGDWAQPYKWAIKYRVANGNYPSIMCNWKVPPAETKFDEIKVGDKVMTKQDVMCNLMTLDLPENAAAKNRWVKGCTHRVGDPYDKTRCPQGAASRELFNQCQNDLQQGIDACVKDCCLSDTMCEEFAVEAEAAVVQQENAEANEQPK